MQLDDTIVAIATAPGAAALAVVRISGPEAAAVLAGCFRRPGNRPLQPRRVHYGHVIDPATGATVDEAIAWLVPPPRTYTRECTAELHCHGGAVAPRRVLAAALAAGARAAEPGEFTLRAFLNGRLDLTQAEAVLDVVEARTDAAMRLALQGLGGGLSQRTRAIRRSALDLLAQVTATIDFPEDDVPEGVVDPELRSLIRQIETLLATADHGALVRTGARIAIVGPPNAGKSTLLNALLGRERAIVSATAGTTRDTLEEAVNVRGVPLVLVDTAGLRETGDVIEMVGVARARDTAKTADGVVLVLDGSRPLERDAASSVAALPRPSIVALNKRDRPRMLPDDDLDALLPGVPRVAVSALTRQGLDTLEAALAERVGLRVDTASAELVVANARHAAALREAQRHLVATLDDYYVNHTADMLAANLAAAIDALGSITGESATDELLATIFSRFCIGK